MPPDLLSAPFAEIAVALALIKSREDHSVRALEAFVAENPRAPLFESVANARAVARIVGELADLFRHLVPIEDDVRSVLAALLNAAERPPLRDQRKTGTGDVS